MNSTISNNEIRTIKSLSQKKYRDETSLFVIEGEKMVAEAAASGYEIVRTYRISDIGAETMSRISQLSSPSPVLALVRQPAQEDVQIGKGLYLALDSIRDPGNLGTIIRIADWFGVRAVVASPDTVELYNPKVVQATMGAIFRVKVHYCDLQSFATDVLGCGGAVYGTFLDGENIYTRDLDPGISSPSVIVIGNESRGISPDMEKLVSDRLFIPPYPADTRGSESLNAAVATAIVTAEFRRRAQ